MPWPQALIRLQQIDLEREEHQERLDEIALELQEDAELARARRLAQQADAAVEAARHTQHELEFELGQVQTKRARTEQNLYSGRIINSRELQDLQAELEALRRRVTTLEDEVLEAMIEREEADLAAKEAAARVVALEQRGEDLRVKLLAERAKIDTVVAALAQEREATTAEIPPAMLDTYGYLRERTGHLPVAQLRAGTCSICGTEVLRPTRVKVERGQEAYCDSCRRLLVAG